MKLIFPKAASQSGFTSANLSSTNDKEASKIVKEIIQNSYDSALEKGVRAKVKFKVEKFNKKEIPFLDEYERVLGLIEKESLTEQENDILNEVKECLSKEEIDVLFIMDNGVGFNKQNLIAMLSDGISVKAQGSGGSYGNGHFSIFNLSFLRFLIYFSKDIFSGHTILRTFIDDTLRDKNGFILNNELPLLEKNDCFTQNVPDVFKDKISEGATIAVLGFNYFLNKESWIDLIRASVIRNFFVAVERDKLEVEIENKKIDKENLDLILQESSEINITPKYREIYKFYSLLDKRKYIFATSLGDVEIYLSDDLETDLALCRNGMYITSKLPSPLRKADFVGYSPFSALILPISLEISNLIKRAEGSLHEDIKYSRFSDDKKGKEKTNKISKKREIPVVGGAEKLELNEITPKDKKSKKKLKIGKEIVPLRFNSFDDVENKKLFISFGSEYKNLFLKIRLDDGTDLTCDKPTSGKELEIIDVKGAEIVDGFILINTEKANLEISYKTNLKNYVINYQFFKAV